MASAASALPWRPQPLDDPKIKRQADQNVERKGDGERHREVKTGIRFGDCVANDRGDHDVRSRRRQYGQQEGVADQQPHGEQEATLVGRPSRKHKKFRFPDDLRQTPIVLPGPESSLRESFDTLMEQAGIRPLIAAEVDDMAMLRLVARESKGVALVPPVVVKDELERGTLVQRARVTGLKETFYAVTASRRFGNPLLKTLLMADGG